MLFYDVSVSFIMYMYQLFFNSLSFPLVSFAYVVLFLFTAISFIISIKLFVYYSLIAANIIFIYIFGFIVISFNFISSIISYGLLILSFYLYLFLSVYYSFLMILFLIELFSSFFNSLTLTNRLSINIFVGSLLINLLSLLSSIFGLLLLAVFFIYESLNLLFQSFIFMLLSFFYLSSYRSSYSLSCIHFDRIYSPLNNLRCLHPSQHISHSSFYNIAFVPLVLQLDQPSLWAIFGFLTTLLVFVTVIIGQIGLIYLHYNSNIKLFTIQHYQLVLLFLFAFIVWQALFFIMFSILLYIFTHGASSVTAFSFFFCTVGHNFTGSSFGERNLLSRFLLSLFALRSYLLCAIYCRLIISSCHSSIAFYSIFLFIHAFYFRNLLSCHFRYLSLFYCGYSFGLKLNSALPNVSSLNLFYSLCLLYFYIFFLFHIFQIMGFMGLSLAPITNFLSPTIIMLFFILYGIVHSFPFFIWFLCLFCFAVYLSFIPL